MAEVVITLKLKADEFQTLREELYAHKTSLDAGAKASRDTGNPRDSQDLLKRSARVSFLLEKLG